jgi:hypothetical protein
MRSNYYARARFVVVVPWLVLMQVLSALVTQNQKKNRDLNCVLEHLKIVQSAKEKSIEHQASAMDMQFATHNNKSSLRNSY